MKSTPKRILLTGGSGFIGRNLQESPLFSRNQIFAPSHSELELFDEVAVREYLTKHAIEVVVHSAAKPGHRNAADVSSLLLTNTKIFFNLARNRERLERMVVIGSGAIYDNRHYRPKMSELSFDEHVPSDEHGFSKYVIEKYLERVDNIFDLRVFGIYGKYEDYQIRFISNMICKALFDLPLTIKQDRKFDYVFVEDLAPIVQHVVDQGLPWPSVNVTPDESVLLSDIARIVLDVLGKPHLPLRIMNPALGSEYSGSNTRLKSVLPDAVPTSLRAGIESLARWYRAHQDSLDVSKLMVDP